MNVHFIGIAGPSCSGKTELARWLSSTLQAPIIPLDFYYHDWRHLSLDQRESVSFDAPESVDQDLLIGHMRRLAAGQRVQIPRYDFGRRLRLPEKIAVSPAPHVIVEGLFTLLWEDLRAVLSTKVYVDTERNVCYRRRLARDVEGRKPAPEPVRRQREEHHFPVAQQHHVLATRDLADVVVNGDAPISESGQEVLMVVRNRQVYQTPYYSAFPVPDRLSASKVLPDHSLHACK